MATRETTWDAIQSMASVWTFPGKDLKATAEAYYLALRDLSDDQLTDAVTALLSSWAKASPPKPADILTKASEFKISSPRPRRLPKPAPSHDDIMHKVRCDTYHVRAITEVLGEERRHTPHWRWTAEESVKISSRQAEMRKELGL